MLVINRVDYWSDITTDIKSNWHMGLQIPTETYETSTRLAHGPQEHTYISEGRPMHVVLILTELNLNYKHVPSHPPYTCPCTRGTTEQLVPQFSETRCIRSTPSNERTTQGSREYGAILIFLKTYHLYRKT